MRNRHRYNNNLLGYIDITMGFMACFIFLFTLTLMMLKVEEKKDAKAALEPKGKLIVHLHWPDSDKTDLDLWAKTDNPTNIVSFRQLDSSNMWLDHDSQGSDTNTVKMSNGTTKSSFGNDEVIQFKECTKTQVVVNVHVYRAETSEFPMDATVELIAADTFNKIATKSLKAVLTGDKGQEVTAFSFNLDEDCKVTNIDQTIFIPFVYKVLSTTPSYTPGSTMYGSPTAPQSAPPQGTPSPHRPGEL